MLGGLFVYCCLRVVFVKPFLFKFSWLRLGLNSLAAQLPSISIKAAWRCEDVLCVKCSSTFSASRPILSSQWSEKLDAMIQFQDMSHVRQLVKEKGCMLLGRSAQFATLKKSVL